MQMIGTMDFNWMRAADWSKDKKTDSKSSRQMRKELTPDVYDVHWY